MYSGLQCTCNRELPTGKPQSALSSLSRGVLPVQAKANGMELDDEPDELKDLNCKD